MEHNPFAPPKSDVDVSEPASTYPIVVAGLVAAVQMLVFAFSFSTQFELVRLGSMNPVGPALLTVSDVLLLVGIVMLSWKRRGKLVFLFAAFGFLLATISVWSFPVPPLFKHLIYTFGVVAAAAGWWVSRRYGK